MSVGDGRLYSKRLLEMLISINQEETLPPPASGHRFLILVKYSLCYLSRRSLVTRSMICANDVVPEP